MTQETLKLARRALTNAIAVRNGESGTEFISPLEENALTAIKEALAEQDIAELVTGMEVSIDVSIGDHDCGNRLFGVVDLVQQSQGSKHGLILLVQETKANFKEALAQRTWVGLTDDEQQQAYEQSQNEGWGVFYNAIETKLKEKNA